MIGLLALFGVFAKAQNPNGKITLQKPGVAPNLQDATRVLSQPRLRITELNQADRLKAVNEALKRQGWPILNNLSPGAAIKLAMPNAASGETFLTFFKPHLINFAQNVAEFNDTEGWQDGSVWIQFKPPAPGKYLVDFSIDNHAVLGSAPFEYSLLGLTNSANQTMQIPNTHEHKISHATFVVDIADTQKQGFIFYSRYGWTFYQCEITSLK
jgi:hypothetical protein